MSNANIGPAFGESGQYPPQRLPGPGDEQTWPPCTGHPNDPRTTPPEFSDLSEREKRAELAALSTGELIDMILALAEDVVRWENRAKRIADILGIK